MGPTPSSPNERFFRPWIQLENVNAVEEVQSRATRKLTDEELIAQVGQGSTRVFELRFFSVEFISNMIPMQYFQNLCIAIVSDPISRATLTHVTGPRDARTKVLLPLTETGDDDDGDKPIANMEWTLDAKMIPGWSILARDGKTLLSRMQVPKNKTKENSVPGVEYVFSQDKAVIKGERCTSQRLDIRLALVSSSQESLFSVGFSVILVMASLTAVTFKDKGEQLTIIVTLLLTSVAQQFGGRGGSFGLMNSALLISIGARVCLFFMMGFIAAELYDGFRENFLVIGPVFVFVLYWGLISAFREDKASNKAKSEFALKAKQSHENEELRLRHLWFPSQAKAEKEVAKQKEAAAKRSSSRFSHRFSRRKEVAKIEDLTPTA